LIDYFYTKTASSDCLGGVFLVNDAKGVVFSASVPFTLALPDKTIFETVHCGREGVREGEVIRWLRWRGKVMMNIF